MIVLKYTYTRILTGAMNFMHCGEILPPVKKTAMQVIAWKMRLEALME